MRSNTAYKSKFLMKITDTGELLTISTYYKSRREHAKISLRAFENRVFDCRTDTFTHARLMKLLKEGPRTRGKGKPKTYHNLLTNPFPIPGTLPTSE